MAEPTLPYTITNGTTANASEVQANDQALLDGITDGTKDIEVAALTTTGSCIFGNSAVDTVTFNGSLAGTIPISANTSYDFGSSTAGLRSIYIGGSSTYTTRIIGGTQSASLTITLPTALPSTSGVLRTTSAGALSWAPDQVNATAKTSNYPLTVNDYEVLGDSSGGAFTFTLPTAASANGKVYVLKKVDSSTTAIAVATTSSQTIDGYTAYSLTTQNDTLVVISDGSNWQVLSRYGTKQVVIGTAQTSNSNTTSVAFTALANSPTVTITPIRTGTFKIFGTIHVSNSNAGAGNYCRIIASSGSPSVLFSQEGYADGPNINFTTSLSPYTLVTLTAGSAYTFTTQFKVSSNTLTLQNSVPTNGHVLVAQEQ